MRSIPPHLPLSLCAVAAALLVSACGGGASPPPAVAGSSGFAVDGYLSGSTVLCDSNGNGSLDVGEATTSSDSSGYFKFSAPCTAMVVVTGGTSVDTQLPFTGKLKAPAGSTIVTPLTTLLAEGMTIDQVNAALGLPAGTDLKNLDPAKKTDGVFVNADLFRKTLVLQQLAQKTTELFAGLASAGGDAARPAIYSDVLAAMAAVLRTSPTLVSGATLDQSAVAALVKASVQRIAASTVLSPEVRSGASGIQADSVSQVIAGSLKVQAEAILAASNADLVTTTKTAQMDTQITSFVQANLSALGAAPGAGTAALATSLTAAVTSSMAGSGGTTTPPAPTPAGTVLVSFDESAPVFTDMGAYGGAAPTVGAGPSAGSGNALRILKAAGQEPWGGVYFGVPAIAFTTDRQTITARVNATRAGAVIKFKVESANGGAPIEVASTPTGAANTWQTVSWNLTGVDLTKSYTTIAITPDQDLTASGQSYYIDDIALAPAATVTPLTCVTADLQCISFSETTIALLGFEGLVSAEVVNDPVAGASNKVAKLVKGPSSQPWAGATIYTAGTVNADPGVHSALSIDTVGLNTSKTVTLRSYSGAAIGTKMTLKLENAIDPGVNIAAETVTTRQNEWETLTFNFANLSTGVFSSSATYNTASVFPSFSIPGPNAAPLAANTTFYFDELKYAVSAASSVGGGGGAANAPTNAPTTTIPSGAVTIYSEAASTAGFNPFPNWGQPTQYSEATIASNKSLKYTGLTYEGIEFTAVNVASKGKLHLDFWSPDLTSVKVSIISAGKENAYTQVITTGGWNGVDIDLGNYTVPDLAAIYQIKLESTTAGTLYVDNIYFWGSSAGASVSCGTTEPTCAPTTTIPSGATTIYSEAASTAGFNPFPNWGQATQYSEATIASNKSLKYTALNYEGLEFTAVNVASKGKLHLDLWTPDLSSVKVSIISAGKENAYTQALTTGGWNGVDIDLSNYTVPDLGAIFQIKLEAATPASGTLYVDNIYFWGTGSTGGAGGGVVNPNAEMGSGGAQTLVLSSGDNKGIFASGEGIFAFDYKGSLDASNNYASYVGGHSEGTPGNGNIGYFQDTALSNSGQKIDEGGWIVGTSLDAGGTPNFFRYFVLTAPASAFASSYMGLYANAPNNGTVNVSAFSSLKFRLWGPAEMYQQTNLNPVLEVVLAGPKVSGCTATGSGGTEITRNLTANQKIGAGSAYKLAFSGFTVKGLCGTDTNGNAVANVLANLARVAVTVPASSFNFSNANANSNPVSYATGVNLGPIGFTNN